MAMPQRDDTIETLKRPAKWSAEVFGQKNPLSSYQAVCRPGAGAGAFFMSILVWGVGIGCFGAAFNNFLVETYDINGFDRGVLESLRETPGVLFVAIFAALFTALWGGRLIERLVDRRGYRNVMIWDTVVLFFVCLLYGFAKDWFPPRVAVAVVCVNYVLDAVLSNASMATNLSARTLSDSQEELTATLSSGISVNHVATVFYALAGGWIWDRFGPASFSPRRRSWRLPTAPLRSPCPNPCRKLAQMRRKAEDAEELAGTKMPSVHKKVLSALTRQRV